MLQQKSQNINEIQYWRVIKEIGSFNDKWAESVATKAEIFNKLIKNLDPTADTVLFAKFNPIALHLSQFYTVTVICDEELRDIFDFGNVSTVTNIDDVTVKYDMVIAADEYFTFADGETEQRSKIDELAKVTNGWLITTLQDYKNFAPHKKNQIDALSVNSSHNYIMLENSMADKLDKQIWNHYWYCIKDHENLMTLGPVTRRTMYFKQLAKYSSDAGSKQYVIQKNLLYKGFFSKNFEHIITVNF